MNSHCSEPFAVHLCSTQSTSCLKAWENIPARIPLNRWSTSFFDWPCSSAAKGLFWTETMACFFSKFTSMFCKFPQPDAVKNCWINWSAFSPSNPNSSENSLNNSLQVEFLIEEYSLMLNSKSFFETR